MEGGRSDGVWTATDEQVRQSRSVETTATMFILLLSCKNPPEDHVRQEKHASVSSARCECFLLFFSTDTHFSPPEDDSPLLSPLTAAEPFYMLLGSSSVAFSSQNLPKLAAASVENVVTALQSHRWTATVRIFVILFRQWVNREKRQKKNERV